MECVGQKVSHRNLYLWKCGFQKNQGPSEPKNLVMVKVVRSKVLYGSAWGKWCRTETCICGSVAFKKTKAQVSPKIL